ncbi:MAG: ThuA domain-containing protein [Lentisphaeraceae bacterium]|nr:ThuA domain-containing protein [Lentisphaeraceae bacterium]
MKLSILRFATLASLLLMLGCQSVAEEKVAKVVFLYGAKSHASGDHEFKAGSHLLANHLNKQSAVKVKAVVISGWPKDESVLDDADAVVIYADGTKVIKHGWEKMDKLVKKGVGCMMMHYAVHPNEAEGEKYFKPWIGGYFKNGQSVNPFWAAEIKPNKDHETCEGVGHIHTIDEFYMNLEYSKRMIPLGTATPTKKNLLRINNIWTDGGYNALNKPQALLWGTERPDGSRGAGFTGGHRHNNWALDGYRQLILNTIVWVAGKEVPKGGVPTSAVSEDELNENLDDYGPKTNRIKLPDPKRLEFTPGPWLTAEEHAAKRRKPKKKKK